LPTYEYQCKSCGRAFEAVQAFSDDPLVTCDVCDGPLKKIYGAVGIVFKGSGFFKTDNRSSGTADKRSAAGASSTNGHDAPSSSESASKKAAGSSGSESSSTSSKTKDAVGTG
jgi:putative FmdB family regulatory protein